MSNSKRRQKHNKRSPMPILIDVSNDPTAEAGESIFKYDEITRLVREEHADMSATLNEVTQVYSFIILNANENLVEAFRKRCWID